MDNLDRTNVAQSAIAKWMLNRQLRDIGLLEESQSVDSYADFMHHFRNGELSDRLEHMSFADAFWHS